MTLRVETPSVEIDPAVRARLGVEPILVERKLGRVHPSWLEALDPRMRAALESVSRAALESRTPSAADVWLARWALADLPVDAPAITPLDLAWLVRIGTEQLSLALGRSTRTDMGPRRAAVERCKDAKPDDELSLVRIAARVLAPHLAAHRNARLQLTRAQPRPIGLVIERELVAHAGTPIDHVPPLSVLRSL
ncbi:MAG TPA: hypothetical protein VMZ53_17995 [Kofleriaceae bacterium]|nr:hypothetical protein [Kofleriaceae bacterium]